MSNQFFLSSLDLSPLVIGIWDDSYYKLAVELRDFKESDAVQWEDIKALSLNDDSDVYPSYNRYTLPVFIRYWGNSWHFTASIAYYQSKLLQVKISPVKQDSATDVYFKIQNRLPMARFQMDEDSAIPFRSLSYE